MLLWTVERNEAVAVEETEDIIIDVFLLFDGDDGSRSGGDNDRIEENCKSESDSEIWKENVLKLPSLLARIKYVKYASEGSKSEGNLRKSAAEVREVCVRGI